MATEQKSVMSYSLNRILEAADKWNKAEMWRIVPGSVQVLNTLDHDRREGVGRIEVYTHSYMLIMEREVPSASELATIYVGEGLTWLPGEQNPDHTLLCLCKNVDLAKLISAERADCGHEAIMVSAMILDSRNPPRPLEIARREERSSDRWEWVPI